ncbi:phosphotransferase [Niveibacterium sp. SC-1]|uniref:phosphotransferase family protein n=1 Tax=Niveibacterium sp. SC-1 TaxID=3135646 RepID=UPI00311FCA10
MVDRNTWSRRTELLALDHAALTRMVQRGCPGAVLSQAALAEGGLANTNYRLELADGRELLLRMHVRSPSDGAKEWLLAERFGGRVPMPAMLHFEAHDADVGLPCTLMAWIEGERLELRASGLDAAARRGLGRQIGAALAHIHAQTYPQTGFLDAGLKLVNPVPMGREGLLACLDAWVVRGRGAARLGAGLTQDLLGFVRANGGLLDGPAQRPCLAHGDFGGANLLIDAEDQLAAVLDWEFAFAGTPFFDLGNLLRAPLGALEGFPEAVAEGYRATGAVLPEEWRLVAGLSDLFSWADFLNVEKASEGLIRDARAVVLSTLKLG